MRENLKNARKAAGMTQKQVADKLEISGIEYRFVHENSFIVCNDGAIFKKYADGLYRVVSPKSSECRYQVVSRCNNGVNQTFLAHRLIAEAFIPNPLNYPQVNHIDGNKANNCVPNLEWCDSEYNVRDAVRRHSSKYLTNLKKLRIANGLSQGTVAVNLHIKLGPYRDIENAVIRPIPFVATKLEEMFGESVNYLLSLADEGENDED